MIFITANGKREKIDNHVSVHAFLIARFLDPDAVVVEYNKKILKTDSFKKTELRENDMLELLSFVGGG